MADVDGGPAPASSRRLRPALAWVVRGFAVFGALVALYLTVTFVQVWRATGGEAPVRADAIVVLGAAQYDGRPSPVFAARLDKALELWQAGWAPRIVTTGGKLTGDRYTEAAAGAGYLRDRGVPAGAIVELASGHTTWDELAAVRDWTHAPGPAAAADRVLLVSDGYHAMRLDQIAGSVGLDARVTTTSADASLRRLVQESGGVALGRLVGYDRLSRLTR